MSRTPEPPAPETQENPWTTRKVETRYENPWIRVEHHDVLTPAGTPGIYGTVRFKNVAVGVVPLDGEGNTWLVGQFRYPLGRYSWEIPEGGAPAGETLEQAAARELQEEVGLGARRWRKILEMDLSNSVTDERAVIFLAQDLFETQAAPEETEKLCLRKVPFETFFEEVLAGAHRDSLTVAAALRVKLLMLAGAL